MHTIRVMVVEPGAALRRRIVSCLAGRPGIEVVGLSAFGGQAVEKLDHVQPDVTVVGVSASSLDSLATLGSLHAARPGMPIVMAGPAARRGSPISLESISLGASGCVFLAEAEAADAEPRDELAVKVMAVAGPRKTLERAQWAAAHAGSADESAVVEAVVVGSSTGGPDVLATLFANLPGDFPAPILIVQHIPGSFVVQLSDRLHALGGVKVRQAVDGCGATPGTAWIGPIGRHLTLKRQGKGLVIRLDDAPPENHFRPSVDVLFESAARVLGSGVVGVVLTGMGRDGLRGCKAIRAAGGRVIVQDESSSVVWGMPGCVAEAGLAHRVLPIAEIGPALVRIATQGKLDP